MARQMGLAASTVGAAQASAVFAASTILVLAVLALMAVLAAMRRRGVLHLPQAAGSPERSAGKAAPLLPLTLPDALTCSQSQRGGGGESPAPPASPCALPCGRSHGGGSKRPSARSLAHAWEGVLAEAGRPGGRIASPGRGARGDAERGKPPLPKQPFAHIDRSRYPWLPPPLQQRATY